MSTNADAGGQSRQVRDKDGGFYVLESKVYRAG